MSHWNHRVVQVEYRDELYFEVREVYYNDAGEIVGMTEKAVGVSGDTLDDMRVTLDRMKKACDKPIIIESEVVYGSWDSNEDNDTQ